MAALRVSRPSIRRAASDVSGSKRPAWCSCSAPQGVPKTGHSCLLIELDCQHGVDAWAGGTDGENLMSKIQLPAVNPKRHPWNKGQLAGQKRTLLPKQVWAIRARLELAGNLRDLALFNLAIDSKLRGCDLVRLKVIDLISNDKVRERVSVIQSKTNRPVQFEVS